MQNWQDTLDAFNRIVERKHKHKTKQHLAADVASVRAALQGAVDAPKYAKFYEKEGV